MIKAEILDPFKLSSDDLALLEKGCAGSWDKADPKYQVECAQQGNAWIFRISGIASGIFVLAVGNREERELVVTCLAGKGMVMHFKEVHEFICRTAAANGTRRLSGYVSRPGLIALYKKTKARPVATVFSEELK